MAILVKQTQQIVSEELSDLVKKRIIREQEAALKALQARPMRI
jgi:hypothetical protein